MADPVFGQEAPYCAGPDSTLKAPAVIAGPLSCDCHAHVCGPQATYAYAKDRIYTPPDALVESYIAQLRVLGVERAVLVQPSVYGADNAVMLAAMEQLAKANIACRGIAVVDPSISDEALNTLDAAGIRGVRFNLVDVADPQKGAPLDQIRPLCERIAALGWHAEFLVHVDDFHDLEEQFRDFPVDIVIGHIGYVRPSGTPQSEGFRAMLRLAQLGKCWIKLTGPYRISAGDLPYLEAGAYARAAITTAPDQVIWGTDWPHVMVTKAMPNDANLLDLLEAWDVTAAQRQKILVANPARLYGF